MRFQLDHDWQGNMSKPRARAGDGAKTQLLLLLCAIWIWFGLIGHAPWKPLESTGISIVKSILEGGSLVAPLASGESALETPPLYYLCAAASAKLFSPILSLHDGARLFNAVWLTILLMMIGMAGRELWGLGVGRHAAFIMIGTIGLLLSAHSLNVEIAGFSSLAMGFYALVLSKRRPWRAGGLFGAALSLGFLTAGVMPTLILLGTALFLPLLFRSWRTSSFATVLSVAILIASPAVMSWNVLFYYQSPELFVHWWEANFSSFNQLNHLYFSRIQIWYAWPALPLSLLGLWHYRHQLIIKPKFQLFLVFFAVSLCALGFGADAKDIHALPLLLPLVALGAGSVEHLKRGAAAALNWFGVIVFGLIGFLIWLGWFAMMTNYPARIKVRMQYLSGLDGMPFHWIAFIIAVIVTLIWLTVCLRVKQTNKSTVTNWALGMTFGWVLLMTLWLPMIDAAKSYQTVFAELHRALPAQYGCVNASNVAKPQALLLNYYTNITLQPLGLASTSDCDLYLIQDARGMDNMQLSSEWRLLWAGKRAAENKESFRLYQRQR